MPKSSHITPVIKSLHWLKINERIKYKLLFLIYKVLTTNQPHYLHDLFNLVTRHVLHPRSLLLINLPGPLWKSLIALFSMVHLVHGTNSPLIFTGLVRYSLLHFHLSHMAVHHLHYHNLHILLLIYSFILNLRRGSSANPFLHRPFLFLPDWLHGLLDH